MKELLRVQAYSRSFFVEKIDFLHFKTKIIANSVVVSFRYAIVAAIGLLVSIAFAHLAPKEVFGQYQFILALFSFFAVFSLPGLNMSALKSISQGESGSVSQAVRLSFLSSLIAVPILVGFGTYSLISGEADKLVSWSFIIFGSLFPFLNAPNTWYVYYEGRLRFLPVALRVVFSSTLTALLLLVFLWNGANVFSLVGVWFFTSLLSGWYFYREVLREERKSKAKKGQLDISYGLRVTLQKFVVGLSENIPIFAISFFFGFQAVANFQVASILVGAVSGLLGALSAMALPVIFSNVSGKHSPLFGYSVLSGIVASLGYALLVETLFLFVYGVEYRESFELAKFFAFLPLLVALRMYFINIFTASEKNGEIIIIYLLANVIAALIFGLSIHSGLSFSLSVALYLYTFNIQLLLSFVFSYLRASTKTVSI